MSSRFTSAPAKIVSSHAARQFFSPWFSWNADNRELLCALHVDEAGRCLRLMQYHGDRAHVRFPLSEIIVDVIECSTSGLIIAHNHPSGDATPSGSDCRATRRLAALSEALGCTVRDHLIFAGPKAISFRECGLL